MDIISELGAALGAGFRVDREMGGGGMSRLFAARDLTLDRDVVVKLYDGEASDLSADRFKSEIQVLARVQHPHVIPILTAGLAGDRPYFVMPYASGESLRARLLRDGALPVADALRILREVLDALAFAHERGIVHRDIKPENILLSAGHAVVADFGIAKALRASGFATSAGIAIGTPAYMAPEQATADPTADHRMDVYALSVVAYEMLTGEPPFRGSVQEIIAAHLTTPPVPLSKRRTGIPQPLANAVMSGLAKSAADRPQTARAYLEQLEAVKTGEIAGPRRERSRTRLLVAGAAVLVAAVAGAWWFTRPVVPRAAQALAVLPLNAPSGDSALTRLGRDLASTLGLTLDGIGALSVSDPATAIALANQKPAPLSDESARAVAQRLGASAYVTGSIVRSGDSLRIDMLLRGTEDTASVLARVSVTGDARDISALTDSLAWGVLRGIWTRGTPPSPSLAGVTTRSLPAMRAFLDAERLWADGRIIESDSAFLRAYRIDTMFLLAAYKHRVARVWFGGQAAPEINVAIRSNLDRLPERERAIAALDTLRTRGEQIRAREALVQRYPDYALAWMMLGDYLTHLAPFTGRDPREAVRPLQRWSELMPNDVNALAHVSEVCAMIGDDACARDAVAATARLVRDRGITAGFAPEDERIKALLLDPKFDRARVEASDTLRSVVTLWQPTHQWLAFDRKPWLGEYLGKPADLAALRLPPQVLEAVAAMRTDTELSLGRVGAEQLTVGPQVWPPADRLRIRYLSSVTGLTERDPSLITDLLARARDTTLSAAARLEPSWMGAALSALSGDTTSAERFSAEIAGDTSYRAGIARATLRWLPSARAGNAAAVDTLLRLTRSVADRPVGYGIEATLRLAILGPLNDQRRYALADSLSRFMLIWPGGPATMTLFPVQQRVMYERARALEGLGDVEGAGRIARAFDARMVNAAPRLQPVRRQFAEMASRLSPGTDRKPSAGVPVTPPRK